MEPRPRAGRAARWLASSFLLLLLAASARAQVARPPVQPPADPLRTIERWTDDYRKQGASLDPSSDERLTPALAALRKRFAFVDSGENEALIALCDLAAVARVGSEAGIAAGRYVADSRESLVRSAARGVLKSALDAPPGEGRASWLAKHVLAVPDEPLPRRIAVAEALIGRHWDSSLLALFTASSAPERGLREVSVRALSGWNSGAVDQYLARLTLRAFREPDFLSTAALLAHFESRDLPADDLAIAEVSHAVALSTVSKDWREAVRRIPLTRAFTDELAMPQLIEALALWHDRGLAGLSSRRVESLIVHELEARSKMKLGMAPERWASWWKTARGRVPGSGSSSTETEQRTGAAFFGLRPCTDRVVFVIDRSGSMQAPFGTDKSSSRYNEALRQLGVFLQQLGPRTHFNVILFSDEPRVWSTALKPATPLMIESVLRWARTLSPDGGTMLRPAVARALELDPRTEVPDLAKLEADTVIVLCDGATTEGLSWVSPLLSATTEATCVRFDCVQIGNTGNGTLEALSAESGGQFVRVED
ncbi:MAG TPA: VWA domain-containing protein [Planctomycetota bacterium]|nr:VWA domain-containing protein [Planctomycetota bacterium]